MAIFFSVLGAGIVILAGVFLIRSPGKLRPYTDEKGKPLAGSIVEKTFTEINGVRQGMFIEGKNISNPVLLFIHGGTAMPQHFLSSAYPTGLEDYFTVCSWERRGAGISYSEEIPPEGMTVEHFISDTLEVTEYLRERFGRDKIYLMGHSGGSFIGIQAAQRAPDLYHAYIGVGQMAYQLESEKMSYEYMLRRFKENGNSKMVRLLEEAPVTMSESLPRGYLEIRDKAMHIIGVGTTRDMKSVITGIFFRSLMSREYTIREKINLWRGKITADALLFDTFTTTDLTQLVTGLEIPAYFFHGIYDYTCCYSLARDYFTKLKAPLKGFYTFQESAHSPMYEEPERMREIFMTDILKGGNSLADIR